MPSRLSPASRSLWGAINLGLGLLPSLAFFVWVERNLALPSLPLQWGWPWVQLDEGSLPWMLGFDASLFLFFGLLHSVFAQEKVQAVLFRPFPRQAWRTIYMAITGLSLLMMMGLWQSSGRLIWALPTSSLRNLILSLVLFWGWMSLSLGVVRGFDALEFVGLRQLGLRTDELGRPAGSPQLFSTGIYAWIRHPMYLFTLVAFVCAPVMTLDRMFLVVVLGVYLGVAIPVEERKLIRLFGPAYLEYRQKVPAMIPYRIPSSGAPLSP